VKYRADIDGLRAVAVVLVLVFHAFPAVLPGGFIGVDVFFVISGYLITGIIRDEKQRGTFSIGHFYQRRIRRIFPALLLVLAASYAAGWLILLPVDFAQLGTLTFAGAAFFSNIALWLQSGYFDIEAARKPLLHLWSLGIEEQFYIVWPVLLWLAGRFDIRMILAVGLASFALNLALVGSHPEATFYLPFTRAWELLAGAGLVYSRVEIKRAHEIVAAIGLALILVAAYRFGRGQPFPGWRALLPVLGTAALLACPGSFVNRVLGIRSVVAVGLISYPLYLWHWPLLVYAKEVFGTLYTPERLSVLALAFVLSAATYWLIEKPIRTGGKGRIKALALAATMSTVAVVGGWTFRAEGFVSRFPPQAWDLLRTSVQADRWRRHECLLLDEDTDFASDCIEQKRPLLFLWGDSTAAALVPGLTDLQRTRSFGLAQFTLSACEPSVTRIGVPYCAGLNRKAFAALEAAKPDIVLLQAIWYPDRPQLDALAETITAIRKLGVPKIVVLGRVPVWQGGLPKVMVGYHRAHFGEWPTRIAQSEQEKFWDGYMRDKLTPLGVKFISAWDALCNKEGCLVRAPSDKLLPMQTDILHLSEAGSDWLVKAIEPDLFSAPTGP
jgi:peptidoglycan/LPS O-acetylase OafA/YrhL